MADNSKKQYVSDNAQLMAEWDWDKNNDTIPTQLTIGSHKKVWWIGKCGHKWDATVKDRIRGNGCPICAGKRIIIGVNDLASQKPLIAKEWSLEDNEELLPSMVAVFSHKVVRWRCSNGHLYSASIDSRVRGRGCPYCAHKYVLTGENDLETINPCIASEWSDKNYPLKPSDVFANSHKTVVWKCSICHNEWTASIDSRQAGNGCPKCAKRLQSSFPEQAIFYYIKNSYPDAVNGYQEIFNGAMELDIYIPSQSIGIEYDGYHWHSDKRSERRENKKYRVCKDNGIYLIRIREKGKNGEIYESDCCDIQIDTENDLNSTIKSLRKILPSIGDIDVNRDRSKIWTQYIFGIKKNSLKTKYPNIAVEWHPTKNGSLLPSMVAAKSTFKVWWLCPNNHSYEDTIAHRTYMGTGCPYCSNRRLLVGFNDFKTTNKSKALFEEWDIEKNIEIGLTMDGLTEGSNKKVWWICPKGHSYQTTIGERKRGRGCSVCAGKQVMMGVNDLTSINPNLSKEWHPTKNGELLPSHVTAESNKRVWWLCQKCGQSWQAIINSRAKGYGCPYCSGRYTVKGKTDLETLNPELAKEWHPVKNGELLPSQVRPGSGKKVWWKCKVCGNEWCSAVKDRNNGHGCPICAKQKRKKT